MPEGEQRLGLLASWLPKLAPLVGLNAEEAQWFWDQAADTIHDLRVLVHGGTFRDGTTFTGVRTIVPEVERHGKAIDAILLRVDGVPVTGSPKGHGAPPQQKKRGPSTEGSR